ncbi:MAG: hypothetical protein C0469_02310 [Cyanobacteria bacterium DS2.3.42]|nr:hypothetical protein [Cyanobacteria bacterium DS2.3.42]
MKSFGNRGGSPDKQPGKPVGRQPQGQRAYNRAYLNENYQQDDNQSPAQFPNQQGGQGMQGQEQWQGQDQWQESDQQEASAVRIEPGKRAGALLIDFVCAYFIGVLISVPMTFIPYMNQFFNAQIAMPVIVLFKDSLFNGRGFGKNLMGLQVVDARTGRPCSVMQSFKRNIILCAPYIILLLVQVVMSLIQLVNLPFPWWQQAHKMVHDSIAGLINIVGMIYVAVVLPMECYRVWRRPDSLRKGDEIAGTMVVDSAMDFSNPLPR